LKVTLSPKAREYVTREAKYLKSGSPRAAQQFADDIKRLRQGLNRFPEMGKFNDEVPVPGVLRFVMGPYLVDYEIRGDEISISRSVTAANVRQALGWTTISTSKNLVAIPASSNSFSGGSCYLIPDKSRLPGLRDINADH